MVTRLEGEVEDHLYQGGVDEHLTDFLVSADVGQYQTNLIQVYFNIVALLAFHQHFINLPIFEVLEALDLEREESEYLQLGPDLFGLAGDVLLFDEEGDDLQELFGVVELALADELVYNSQERVR